MKTRGYLFTLLFVFVFVSIPAAQFSQARHVILIGLDAMSARGLQRAKTPHMNDMIENGTISLKTRCIRPTSSSQNWMSMLSGAVPEMHGVTGNDWEPDNYAIPPALKNNKGLFPTIFDAIRNQKPDHKIYMYYEWPGQDRMYDISVADRAVTGLNYTETITQAIDAFFEDKPDFLFISINETDHIGHEYGHESREYLNCITYFDTIIGDLVKRLDETGMLQNTVVIVTADHGGIGKAHGGDSEAELEIPVLLYGGNVTKGKVIEETHLICDIAATVAGLLDVHLPPECAGKFITEAFKPATEKVYVPMPFIQPAGGFFKQPAEIVITGDVKDAQIYYTLDGSEPSLTSIPYTAPFTLTHPAIIRAVVCRNEQSGMVADAFIRILPEGEIPKVSYKYYENWMGKNLPDFTTLGQPLREGYVYEFTLEELDVEEKDHFAVLFNSRLEISEPGKYTFGVISDDGSKVYINGKLIIDNDGSHSPDMKHGFVELERGIHDIRIEYFDDYMGQKLELYYSSGTTPLQPVPFSKLHR